MQLQGLSHTGDFESCTDAGAQRYTRQRLCLHAHQTLHSMHVATDTVEGRKIKLSPQKVIGSSVFLYEKEEANNILLKSFRLSKRIISDSENNNQLYDLYQTNIFNLMASANMPCPL